jgi:hypothetical protein
MKYFTTVVLPTGMGVPGPIELGEVRLGLEAGWIPTLTPEQRRVGFNGTKKEDLNKVPVLGRMRLAVGLPWQLTADATWAPPVEVNGVTSHPFSLGLGRPLIRGGAFTLGARGYVGRFWSRGSFTCSGPAIEPAGEHGDEDVHAADMSDCAAASHDKLTSRYAGVEMGGAYRFARASNLEAYASASVTYMDLEFQVDAQLMHGVDRSRLTTDGTVTAFAGGLRYPITNRLDVAGEAFYAPLTVHRPDSVHNTEIDGLFNLRGLLEYTF